MTTTVRKSKPAAPSALPRRVGIKEFKDKATQLLAADEPFVVERHGKAIGYYTPFKRHDPKEIRAAADKLNATMEHAAREMGISVDELEDILFAPMP
ncbi:hypothetical protein ACI3L1_16260 [Deinococcus sp. SM5_A1]|uniref:hypothetical protein n=1 Tax=Deinococcus sp. SM5_A1 TaxID=3379094 RepID=UPI00385DD2E5